ncbi:MAG: superoxide dismutase [Alloprevotella sp.]|nr:superoxide dismutase [Alloprevotella sp.]
MMFTLIELPYKSLTPVISDETLSFHHGKHLQTYVDNLNKLIAGTEFEGKTLEDIVCSASGGIFNNAGQILNHELYFTQFTLGGIALTDGLLKKQIEKQWGNLEAFQSDFEAKGVGLFGSGWIWLSTQADGELVITQEPNAGNPVATGLKPLLTFDVWEHAYYLDYQNRRAAHLNALWSIVDWSVVERRYAAV